MILAAVVDFFLRSFELGCNVVPPARAERVEGLGRRERAGAARRGVGAEVLEVVPRLVGLGEPLFSGDFDLVFGAAIAVDFGFFFSGEVPVKDFFKDLRFLDFKCQLLSLLFHEDDLLFDVV